MADLLDTLSQRLDEPTIRRLSERLDADPARTEQAVGALLPILIGALATNAESSEDSRRSLQRALERDHDGGLLDALPQLLGGGDSGRGSAMGGGAGGLLAGALGSLLGGTRTPRPEADSRDTPRAAPGDTPRAADADGILEHLLGDRREPVARGVAQAVGLERGTVERLMQLLAPMVMAALGRRQREQQLDAGGVTELLERERRDIETQAPQTEPGGLKRLLDSNRDGRVDLGDDIAKVGMALGAAFLASRRRRR